MTINHTPPLTFPTLPFAKLEPSAFLAAHLSHSPNPTRPSGRTPSQTRKPTLHTGSLSHAHGSAVIRCGDTSVVCGVRGEILRVDDIADWKPSKPTYSEDEDEDELSSAHASERAKKRRKLEREDIARLNLLVPNVELATGCSPGNLPGGPPSLQAQVLAQRLLCLLHEVDVVGLEMLRIWGGGSSALDSPGGVEEGGGGAEGEGLGKRQVKAFWVLYIDVLFLSLNGPPLDSAWLAILAALKDTRLPPAKWDTEREGVICDPEVERATGLGLRDLPLALTCGVFVEGGGSAVQLRGRRKWILADMDGFEEGLCKESITVVVGARGRLLRIEKGGGGKAGGLEIKSVVEAAEKWRRQCIDLLES